MGNVSIFQQLNLRSQNATSSAIICFKVAFRDLEFEAVTTFF